MSELRTYMVIRSVAHPKDARLNKKEIVERGLSWEAASKLCEELQRKEREAHPERTSWTSDIYYRELEKKEMK